MATLKYKEIEKLSDEERQEKIKQLKMEIIKNKGSVKSKTNIKEVRKAIARILTFNRLNQKTVGK